MVNLRSRILAPLLSVLLLMLIVAAAVLQWQVSRVIERDMSGQQQYIKRLYEEKLSEHVEVLLATLLAVQQNVAVGSAVNQKDGLLLQKITSDLYLDLSARDLIVDLFFLDSKRILVVSLDGPELKSEPVAWQAVVNAEGSGIAGWALELDASGNLVLRVVMPWYRKEQLLGYVGFESTMTQILNRLARLLDPMLFLALQKSSNEPGKFDSARATGRKSVALKSSGRLIIPVEERPISDGFYAEIDRVLYSNGDPPRRFSYSDKQYSLVNIPLRNEARLLLADILMVVDISRMVSQANKASATVLFLVVVLGGIVFIVLFLVTKFTEKQIVRSRQELIQAKEIINQRFLKRTRELRRSETSYRELVEYANNIILRWSSNGVITFCNRYACEFFGYRESEIIGRNLMETIVPEVESVSGRNLRKMVQDIGLSPENYIDNENENRRQDGSRVWVSWSNRAVKDDLNQVSEVLSIGYDITAKKEAENELKLAASVFENIVEGVLITDSKGKILRTNRAYTAITGYSEQESVGKTPGDILKSERHGPSFFREMWHSLNSKGYWQGEIWNKRKSGEVYPEWLGISCVNDDNGITVLYVGVFTDITDQKMNEEQIYHLAHYDVLTNLPNRILFQDRLNQALNEARRNNKYVPLLFLDLDRFKPVNDSLGHGAGDHLLQQIAKRLANCLRESDTLARMGGDEFTIIIGPFDSIDEVVASAATVAQNVNAELSRPFDLEGNEINISASIGIATFPQDGQSLSYLLRNADVAMYHAKKQAAGFLFFESHMNQAAVERLVMENHIYKALEKEEFEVFYQPCVSLITGKIESVEALVRWNHPHRGKIEPDEFIGIAEESGLISSIGEWVLYTAISQLVAWRAQGFDSFGLSVNVSPRQLRDKNFAVLIKNLLDDCQISPDLLTLEVTESAFVDPISNYVNDAIDALSETGIHFSIDDFGTGYSSLSRLKLLPVDTLKIDRSFVARILEDPMDANITVTIIDIARNLQKTVIAEGVENAGQIEFLRSHGCDLVQGFLISEPLTGSDFEELLRLPSVMPDQGIVE